MANEIPQQNYYIASYLVDRVRDLGFDDISMRPLTVEHFDAVQHLPLLRQLTALRWAADVHVTVAEMLAWDRAVNGEDLSAGSGRSSSGAV